MQADGVSPAAISAFESNFNALASGATGIIPESTISPVPSLDKLDDLNLEPDTTLLAKTVVLKLNGGLGTGMGLDKAKSLLKVKGEDTFLDMTAKQVADPKDFRGRSGLGGPNDAQRAGNIVENGHRTGETQEFLPSYFISELTAQ